MIALMAFLKAILAMVLVVILIPVGLLAFFYGVIFIAMVPEAFAAIVILLIFFAIFYGKAKLIDGK